jgi:hypothetical protein
MVTHGCNMEICHRCYNKDKTVTPASDGVTFRRTPEAFGLCTDCAEEIHQFIVGPYPEKKKRGRPKKGAK